MLKAPEIKAKNEQKIGIITIGIHEPQIVSGMAMIPIEATERHGIEPEIIESAMLNRDLLVRDDLGSYDRMNIQNQSNEDILIPAGTHFLGGNQNRGNDHLQLLQKNGQKVKIEAHCFEPGRSSGRSQNFEEVSETPIDIVFQTMTTSGTGASWNAIDTYHRVFGRSRGSLKEFLEKTEKERFKLALNYETLRKQTGVISVVGNSVIAMEIYPNIKTFNKHREDIYSGKFASLLWKKIQKNEVENLTPQDVRIRVDGFLKLLNEGITVISPIKHGDYEMFSIRKGKFIADVILNDRQELVYMFAMATN